MRKKLRTQGNAQTAQCADSESDESQAQRGINEDEASQTAQQQNCAGPETKRNGECANHLRKSGRICAHCANHLRK
jgi:hypothetical protein